MGVKIEFPEKLEFLFKPSRYKVLYGGRGGAKSWGVARALLIRGAQSPIRVLCAREFQSSIQDSVHRLLGDQINALGLGDFYEVQKSSIRGINGTEFSFEGIRHNVSKIKSYEGADICWVEEADQVSKSSWDVIVPTIRKSCSEIWATFNPQLETDETYKRFIINPPPDSIVVKVNYSDNPWFPDVLLREMEHLKLTDRDAYLNIWEGNCRVALEGAIYAKEMRAAIESGRITRVLPNPLKPIDTFWDLGKRDHTAIWFAQLTLGEYRILRFYQNRGQDLKHYADYLRDTGYNLGTIWLPHDAEHDRLGSVTIEKQLRNMFPTCRVRVIPRMARKTLGIAAVRTIFPNCYFDEELTADGRQCLTHYRYEVDPDTKQYSDNPLHDEYSDGADAFAQLALAIKEPKSEVAALVRTKTIEIGRNNDRRLGWMGN
jgi:phage terminase large subunit